MNTQNDRTHRAIRLWARIPPWARAIAAAALGVEIEALFARPAPGDEAPGPLPSGRKRRTA